jgi:ubiquinone/menaquinone biosynthesis C-methylase UbiE
MYLNKLLNASSENFIQQTSISRYGHVLDLACGHGFMSCWFAKYIVPYGKVTAVDVNPEQIKVAKQQARKNRLDNIEFRIMSAYDLAALGENYDMLYHRLFLITLTNPAAALKAMIACLKPGGYLISESAIYSHCYSDPEDFAYERYIHLAKQLLNAQGKYHDPGKNLHNYLQQLQMQPISYQIKQPTLVNSIYKTLIPLQLERIQGDLIQERVAEADEIKPLLKQLYQSTYKIGLWTLPSLCQNISYKTK